MVWQEGCKKSGALSVPVGEEGGEIQGGLQWECVEIVRPGVLLIGAVLLVGIADPSGLARGIEAAITMRASERDWRTRRAAAAAQACFSLKSFTDKTLEVYRELL